MKTLIVLVVGMLAVGCLTPEQKQKRLRDSVAGEYEYKYPNGTTHKQVFQKDVFQMYKNGEKQAVGKWSIVDGEIHAKYDSGYVRIYRINKDKSYTSIASISGGKRTDKTKEEQWTYKKIK